MDLLGSPCLLAIPTHHPALSSPPSSLTMGNRHMSQYPSKEPSQCSSPAEEANAMEEESFVVVQGESEAAERMHLSPPAIESPATVVSIPSCNLKCIRFSNADLQETCRPKPLRHVNKLASFPCETSAEIKILSDLQRRDFALRKSRSLDGIMAGDGDSHDGRWDCTSPLCHVELSPAPHPLLPEEKQDTIT